MTMSSYKLNKSPDRAASPAAKGQFLFSITHL